MINGIINIYKERGYTSHDVVAKMRGILRQRKIGHTGTLDPDAEGVLPVCLGSATKLCDMMTDKSKEYQAVLLLGVSTDTQDITGKIMEERSVECDEEKIRAVISSFIGQYMQIPPMYSALKVNGQKLVDLARAGIEIERKARPVEIFHIQIQEINLPRVRFLVHCSKGTYIRTLCADIGEKLGCLGTMESLIRTRVASFTLENAISLDQLEKARDADEVEKYIIHTEQYFIDLPLAVIKEEYQKYADNGNKLKLHFLEIKDRLVDKTQLRLRDKAGHFFGVYEYIANENCLKPYKLFREQ